MKWQTVSSTCWKAEGAKGTFTIQRKGTRFWPEYNSQSRSFKLPPADRLSRAKEMCEDNIYWEGD